MEINIKKLAGLARLSLTAEEETKFAGELGAILKMADNLPSMDTDIGEEGDVKAMQMREDSVESSLPRELLLAGAPLVKAGCVVVPRVVEVE